MCKWKENIKVVLRTNIVGEYGLNSFGGDRDTSSLP
jgi:hypothetical protein